MQNNWGSSGPWLARQMTLHRSQPLPGLPWGDLLVGACLSDLGGKDQDGYGSVHKAEKGSQKERVAGRGAWMRGQPIS